MCDRPFASPSTRTRVGMACSGPVIGTLAVVCAVSSVAAGSMTEWDQVSAEAEPLTVTPNTSSRSRRPSNLTQMS